MMRVDDWPQRLAAFIEARRHLAFAWGVHDCALMAADWVHECTGTDPASPLRGTYHTAAEAARIIARAGSLAQLADAQLQRLPSPLHAGRGDVALVTDPEGCEVLGIMLTDAVAAPGPHGLTFAARADAMVAWSV